MNDLRVIETFNESTGLIDFVVQRKNKLDSSLCREMHFTWRTCKVFANKRSAEQYKENYERFLRDQQNN